jgi:purine-binding chemotaxis protein CheW
MTPIMNTEDVIEEYAFRADSSTVQQFLTFMLQNKLYGVEILTIKEIVGLGNMTRVPMVASFIAGVINLRGSVVPVIDLAKRFNFDASERTKRSSIVIVEVKDKDGSVVLGITVDEVNEVIDIALDNIEPTPDFGTNIRTDFIKGMGKLNRGVLILLNLNNILSITEISNLNENRARLIKQ